MSVSELLGIPTTFLFPFFPFFLSFLSFLSNMPFPSKFAVFRGPYDPKISIETADSAMIFKATPSGEFFALSVCPWMGYIVESRRMPDKTVHAAPVRMADKDGAHSVQPYIVLPYAVERIIPCVGRSEQIPMIAFANTDWMPPPTPASDHMLEMEEFKRRIRHIPYIANVLMNSEDSAPHIMWFRCMKDPYSILNDIVIASIPLEVAADVVYMARNNVIQRRYEELESAPWKTHSP